MTSPVRLPSSAGTSPRSRGGGMGVPELESSSITVTRLGEPPTEIPSHSERLVLSSHWSRRLTLSLVPSIVDFSPARTLQSATSSVLFAGSATMVPSSHASGSTGVNGGAWSARAVCCAASATIATARKTSQRLTGRLGSGDGRDAAGERRRHRPRGASCRAPPPADAPSPRGCEYVGAKDGPVPSAPTAWILYTRQSGCANSSGQPWASRAQMMTAPGRIEL